jgi:radical SAM protein with 4Fe4S-binding SPASM domain
VKEYTYTQLNQALFAAARRRRAPLYGQFELTRRCNLRCVMCYIRQEAADPREIAAELTAGQWIDLARQASDEGLLYLLLTGGEALIRQDFFTILDGISRLGLNISLNTNATLLTPALVRELARYPLTSITVTLYGASPATYDKVCGSAAAFERTLGGVRLLREQGIRTKLRTTITRQNADDLPRMFEVAEELDVVLRVNRSFSGRRREADSDPYAERLAPEEWAACEAVCERYWQRKAEEAPERREQPPDTEDIWDAEHLPAPEGPPGPEDAGKNAFDCMAGHTTFTVNPDGRLCACMSMAEPSLPLLPELRFRQGWERLKVLSDQVPVCEECLACERREICKPCPSKLQGETGSPARKAPYLCRLAELRADGSSRTAGSGR